MTMEFQAKTVGNSLSRPADLPLRLLQRKCACEVTPEQGEETRGILQRKASGLTPAASIPPLVHEVLRSTGRPLEPSTRAFIGPRFGHDFGRVRVHTDARAAESARQVNALAYTVGRDIVFAAGQFRPQSADGRQLIAHELAHVVQQGGRPAPAGMDFLRVTGHDRYDQAAEAAGRGVTSGRNVQVSRGDTAGMLQRAQVSDGGKQAAPDPCAGYEQDPESLSIETAKHFLDDVEPGAKKRLVKSTDCKANEYNPDRIECDVTFDDGTVIHVSIERKLHNVEGQRQTPGGREWCVYHFTCEGGQLQFHKKGCSADYQPKPPASSGPDLVGSSAGVPASRGQVSV
jgi:hypothetical protein